MRRAANVDTVQPEICAKLRQVGVKVLHLHQLGSGVPDILAGYRGVNVLLEVKTGNDSVNAAQRKWHAAWPGQVATVRSFDEAMEAILAACSTQLPRQLLPGEDPLTQCNCPSCCRDRESTA